MRVLGIESSCDETAAAVVDDGRVIVSNVIATQIPEHARFGGVVPEIASRKHVEAIIPVIREALTRSETVPRELDGIAVTCEPGLKGALLVGVAAAKALAWSWDVPLVGVNHIHAHICSNFLQRDETPLPHVALVVSGGHTMLALVENATSFDVVGSTRDDAAGEAFDKAAKILGLGFPGGPAVEHRA